VQGRQRGLQKSTGNSAVATGKAPKRTNKPFGRIPSLLLDQLIELYDQKPIANWASRRKEFLEFANSYDIPEEIVKVQLQTYFGYDYHDELLLIIIAELVL